MDKSYLDLVWSAVVACMENEGPGARSDFFINLFEEQEHKSGASDPCKHTNQFVMDVIRTQSHQINTLTKAAQKSAAEISSLKTKLKQTDDDARRSEVRECLWRLLVKVKKADIAEREEQRKALQAKVYDAERRISELSADLASARDNEAGLLAKLALTEVALNSTNARVKDLNVELESANRRCETNQNVAVGMMGTMRTCFQDACKVVHADNRDLYDRLQKLTLVFKATEIEYETKMSGLRTELDEVKEKEAETNALLAERCIQLADANGKLAMTKKEVEEMEVINASHVLANNRLKQTMEEQCKRFREKLSAVELNFSTMHADLLRSRLNEHKQKELQKKLQEELNTDKETLRATIADMESKLEAANRKCQNLQDRLNSAMRTTAHNMLIAMKGSHEKHMRIEKAHEEKMAQVILEKDDAIKLVAALTEEKENLIRTLDAVKEQERLVSEALKKAQSAQRSETQLVDGRQHAACQKAIAAERQRSQQLTRQLNENQEAIEMMFKICVRLLLFYCLYRFLRFVFDMFY